jgi:hypothetical protein
MDRGFLLLILIEVNSIKKTSVSTDLPLHLHRKRYLKFEIFFPVIFKLLAMSWNLQTYRFNNFQLVYYTKNRA